MQRLMKVAFGITVLVLIVAPTSAFAYKSEADCESYEGKGKCKHCPQGQGDPGWHTTSACNAIHVMPPTERPRAAQKLTAEEAAKIAEATKRPAAKRPEPGRLDGRGSAEPSSKK